jgi:predicted nucleic acid-binding Zn ribbon protein
MTAAKPFERTCQRDGCGKIYDRRERPPLAKTCSPECSTIFAPAQRKKRWAVIGEKANALSRERHRPIIKRLPLGTLVRERWTRPPNMVVCANLKCDKGENGEPKVFDSKRGAVTCSPGCSDALNKRRKAKSNRKWRTNNPEKAAELAQRKSAAQRAKTKARVWVTNTCFCGDKFKAQWSDTMACPKHRKLRRRAGILAWRHGCSEKTDEYALKLLLGQPIQKPTKAPSKTKPCEYCAKIFIVRDSSKFCSGKCRKAYREEYMKDFRRKNRKQINKQKRHLYHANKHNNVAHPAAR